jgi:hypothetical protein
MKGQDSVELERKFEKAKHSLLIETRKLRLSSLYELAISYNARMVSISKIKCDMLIRLLFIHQFIDFVMIFLTLTFSMQFIEKNVGPRIF